MECRLVKWNKRALRRIDEVAQWYEEQVGSKARENFLHDTLHTIDLLSRMPQMGRPENATGNDGIYSFTSHALIKIAYRFTDKDITIVAIRSTRMS